GPEGRATGSRRSSPRAPRRRTRKPCSAVAAAAAWEATPLVGMHEGIESEIGRRSSGRYPLAQNSLVRQNHPSVPFRRQPRRSRRQHWAEPAWCRLCSAELAWWASVESQAAMGSVSADWVVFWSAGAGRELAPAWARQASVDLALGWVWRRPEPGAPT